MAILSIHNLDLSFGGDSLLKDVHLHVNPGDRICLMGRNGTGKSTLLKIVAGDLLPDRGTVRRDQEAKTTFLSQDLPADLTGSALSVASRNDPSREQGARQLLTRLAVSPEASVETLSGGALRRVLLAQTLATPAEILLLDEPTNHLDLDTVLWLETYLERLCKSHSTAIIFVTHDRAFARRLAQTVGELDRGTLYHHDCGYDEFLSRRDKRLSDEEAQWEQFNKDLAKEEAWLRRGVKARRTRDEGRVRRLLEMRNLYQKRREQIGSVEISLEAAQRSGDLVITTKDLSFSYDSVARDTGEPPLIKNLSTLIMRGDRVGIVGPNGSGKTTLIKLLLGELTPQTGSVRRGANLQPLYFDQLRSSLDPEKTLWENLGDGYDTVTINGKTRHLLAYMEDFLFSREEVNKPVSILSGGERNRLLLAKFFARPSNLLILDEPTNDLDGETLELLEQILLDYQGTILLVSHDRAFLDNVVTDCLVLSGDGTVQEYAGGYGDWRDRQNQDKTPRNNTDETKNTSPTRERNKPRRNETRLSYKEKQELEELPQAISALEEEEAEIHRKLSDPDLYRTMARQESGSGTEHDPGQLSRRLDEVGQELARAYERWEELEGRRED
ncbi:ATP-binding cassette, subfamily F, uup [Alkalispirochaeta americana]|uniref:ATP-binding protein Uup n=1 Tax=Alkalispirochaeta americana TaxID=159291 RepID=A0A1N6SDG2_9SPIO|nr:ATP-binding cassette domain-containing protein [Alkalispirochaeta americana]SIQ39006.1 ATP-binding cassette, subfamily F, uup [Alkalispirochaeta americana]